ncbi:hypothetical protein Bbelb_276340 [Branchiostoma belcheri]|nr:hypothetical protein Bbelb_276340 [Branchiostoma belcheri]
MTISPSYSLSGLVSRDRETTPRLASVCWALREGDNNSRKDKGNKEQSRNENKEQLPASYLDKKCGVIYKIKCKECGEVYVSETECLLGERTSEHQKSLHQKDCKYALSQHQLQAGHNITTRPISDSIEIIDQESRNPHRKIKEAVHIQLDGAKLNRTEGWELPKTFTYPFSEGGNMR